MTWQRNRRTIISLRLPVSVWYNCHTLSLSSWKAKYKSFVMSFPRLHTRYNGICSFHRRPAKTCAILFRYKETHEVHPSSFTKNEALVPNWRVKKLKKHMRQQRTLALSNLSRQRGGDYSVMVNVIVWHHRRPLPDIKLISGWSMVIHIFYISSI